MSTVLITGASAGIGREFAAVCARAGHDLVLTARNEERLGKIAGALEKKYGVTVRVMAGDLTDAEFRRDLVARLELDGEMPDILINNAGFGTFGLFKDSGRETNAAMVELNVTALVDMTQLLLPSMRRRGRGRILNVASTAAFQPGPYMTVYYATKAFVLSFSEGLAEELRGSGVTVTTLCPGPTQSEFAERAGAAGSKLFAGNIPTSRDVAIYGYRQMMRGRRVVVHGGVNRFLAFGTRFAPRPLLAWVVGRLSRNQIGPK